MPTRYHGKKGVVYGSTSGTGVASRLVSLSKWSLDMSTEKTDVTTFDDAQTGLGNKVFVQGPADIKGQLAGFWDSSDDSLFDAAESADGMKLYLYPAANAAARYWYGPAWLDASIDVDVKGACSVSGNFVAAGSWGRM